MTAQHRSDPRAPWWRWLWPWRMDPMPVPPQPVWGTRQPVAVRSQLLVLTASHPAAVVPCLICQQRPAGPVVRLAVITSPSPSSYSAWSLDARSYIICADHPTMVPREFAYLAHQRENPECGCHLLGTAGPAASDYHHLNGRRTA